MDENIGIIHVVGNDFTVSFDNKGIRKTLHIPWDDLLDVPEVLNSLLRANGVNSWITNN